MPIEDKLVEVGLHYIKYAGSHPYQSGYKQKALWITLILSGIYSLILTFIGFFKIEGNVDLLANKTEGFMCQLQVIKSKYLDKML